MTITGLFSNGEKMEKIIEFKNISKRFGTIKANSDISFSVYAGEVMALLGENGSGKTTLMNMLSGIYYPDEGQIFVNGKEARIKSPVDAFALKIGMVHQHFKLVDSFSALENIVLGIKATEGYDLASARTACLDICNRYGFELNLDKIVHDMNVSEKQTLEIIKVLYRGAEILILDEPTTVLTPQESQKLFEVIRNMRADNKAVIIITHKLQEVLEISDRVAILRKGNYIATVDTKKTNAQELTNMMVGEQVKLDIARDLVEERVKRLEVKNLSVKNAEGKLAIDDVSFEAYSGEILGIAGISGNGQKELLEGIMGLVDPEPGSSVVYNSTAHGVHELVGLSTQEIIQYGLHLAFVPEDRLGMGLVGSMGMTNNFMLKKYYKGKGPFLHKKKSKELASQIKDELDVATPYLEFPVRRLSGGNVQKVLVGREITAKPTVLMTAYAVRGLDINTSYAIYNILNEQKKKGVAVIYVGEDLDVLLALSDRIMVLCDGKVNGILDGRTATKDEVGYLMAHLKEDR